MVELTAQHPVLSTFCRVRTENHPCLPTWTHISELSALPGQEFVGSDSPRSIPPTSPESLGNLAMNAKKPRPFPTEALCGAKLTKWSILLAFHPFGSPVRSLDEPAKITELFES